MCAISNKKRKHVKHGIELCRTHHIVLSTRNTCLVHWTSGGATGAHIQRYRATIEKMHTTADMTRVTKINWRTPNFQEEVGTSHQRYDHLRQSPSTHTVLQSKTSLSLSWPSSLRSDTRHSQAKTYVPGTCGLIDPCQSVR